MINSRGYTPFFFCCSVKSHNLTCIKPLNECTNKNSVNTKVSKQIDQKAKFQKITKTLHGG